MDCSQLVTVLASRERIHLSMIDSLPDNLNGLEESVSLDSENVQIDVSALTGVGQEGESECIRAAFGYAVRIVPGLACLRCCDFTRIQIAVLQLLVQRL
ncbi:hypothetical protein WR25_18265 [Diploscapter pachys]|uniref:Uncharacterized protein n=1 Tax=Diploscapter pachys TaxID=2018661 RepID=A0A2A2LM92_9BILA|nr:hypothetical protein WR25_18265 [Diploscapter pachys]